MGFQQFLPQVEQFLKLKNLSRQAVLILDNASHYPDAQYIQDKEIQAIHLPPNVTSLIQPMGQGVLAALKKRYGRKLLSSLMLAVEEGDDLVAKLKNIDLLDVIGWVSQCWNELEPITFVRSWRKLLDHSGNDFSEVEEGCETELVNLMRKVPGCEETVDDSVREWMELDGASEPLGKDEIVAAVKDRGKEEEEDDLESNMESSQQEERITHGGGVKSFEVVYIICNNKDHVQWMFYSFGDFVPKQPGTESRRKNNHILTIFECLIFSGHKYIHISDVCLYSILYIIPM